MSPPDEVGCHDWAMFYARGGWCENVSLGFLHGARGNRSAAFFGNLDPDRMVANSVFAAPFTPPMMGFRADPAITRPVRWKRTA